MKNTSTLIRLTILALVLSVGAIGAAQGPPQKWREVLTGLDAIELVRGKEVQGKEKFFSVHEGLLYLFATEENKVTFDRDPARYGVQLGGSCTRMGPPTGGSPDLFAVHDGRIYLFGSEDCQRAFEAEPTKFLETGSSVAPTLSADARTKGRALLKRAIDGMGGGTRIAAVKNYVEKALNVSTGMNGATREMQLTTTVVLPGRARFERAGTFGKYAEVLVDAQAVALPPNNLSQPLNDFRRAHLARQRDRLLLVVLRGALREGAQVGTAGTMTAGGTTLEKVMLRTADEWVALGIDAKTAQILALEYRARGTGGEVGMVTRTFADYRDVDGLRLPFKQATEFKGQPMPSSEITVQSIVINGPIDSKQFDVSALPKPSGQQ